jgi:hypothetical protein
MSLKEQCPWIGLMFAVRHLIHRHGQRWVRNRRQVQILGNAKNAKKNFRKTLKIYCILAFFAFFLRF